MHRGAMTAVLSHLRATVTRGTAGPSADAELLGRYVAGKDAEAFAEIVRRHGPLVWAVCRDRLAPADAEDAFQATFLVLARKAGGIAKRESLASWLSGVAYRIVLQARSRAGRRKAVALPAGLAARPVPDAAEASEERAAVAAAVDRLAEKYRLPVLLCYYQGLTVEEAAARLGWPTGTVAGRLARARDQLRRRLHGLASVPPAALVSAASQPVSLAGRVTVAAIAEATMKAAFWGKVQAVALVGGVLAATGVGWGLRPASAQAPKAKAPDKEATGASLPAPDEPDKRMQALEQKLDRLLTKIDPQAKVDHEAIQKHFDLLRQAREVLTVQLEKDEQKFAEFRRANPILLFRTGSGNLFSERLKRIEADRSVTQRRLAELATAFAAVERALKSPDDLVPALLLLKRRGVDLSNLPGVAEKDAAAQLRMYLRSLQLELDEQTQLLRAADNLFASVENQVREVVNYEIEEERHKARVAATRQLLEVIVKRMNELNLVKDLK